MLIEVILGVLIEVILGVAGVVAIFGLRVWFDIKASEAAWYTTWDPKWGEAPPYPHSDKHPIYRIWMRLRDQ